MHPEVATRHEQLRARLAQTPSLASFDVAGRAEPSIRLTARRTPDEKIALGQSRIGGLPDLLPDFEWPRWAPSEDRLRRMGAYAPPAPASPLPLGFIAQLDLSWLAGIDDSLPSSGWLWFFYDRYVEPWGFHPADRNSGRVFYSDCDRGELSRTFPPEDSDLERVAASCTVETSIELTLPDPYRLEGLAYRSPAWDDFLRLREQRRSYEPMHRFLGRPEVLQNPMELECQLASNGVYCGDPAGYESEEGDALAAGAADWRLLLQIDTDEAGPGWMWGDSGRIYFWIKRQDLAARRFDDVWVILQCC